MKTFRLIGMALIAVMLCVNFTACNGPKTSEDGIVINQKRIVAIKAGSELDQESNSVEFAYDSKGRLVRVQEGQSITTFTWNDKTIIAEERDGKYSTHLSYVRNANGMVECYESDNDVIGTSVYTYDSFNRMCEDKNSSLMSSILTCRWVGEKLTEVLLDDELMSKFSYSGKTCKGYSPFIPILLGDANYLSFTHPELFGLRTTKLCNDIIFGGEKGELVYTLNKDGYVETMKWIIPDEEEITYTFTWE